MTPAEDMHLKYTERQAERRKLKLIDIRDNLQIDRSPHALASSVKFLIEEIDAFLSEEMCPGEGPVEKCPDCGSPWWTVQKRCKCWPKPGKVGPEVSDG